MTDIIDTIAGLDPAASHALRSHRPDVIAAAQASYDALLPENTQSDAVPAFDIADRLLAAARAAHLEASPAALEHYLQRIDSPELRQLVLDGPDRGLGLTATRRQRAILRHTELLILRPAAATPSDLGALHAAGLDDAQIVVLSQVVSFISFQVRVAHALTVLKETL